jgi:hypothetical protein
MPNDVARYRSRFPAGGLEVDRVVPARAGRTASGRLGCRDQERRSLMKKLVVAIAAGALGVGSLGVGPAAAVQAPTPRADGFVDIWCDSDATNLDGTGAASITPGDSGSEGGVEDDVLAKRVDARAIQLEKDPGGKDTATDRYNATAGVVQGWFCGEF